MYTNKMGNWYIKDFMLIFKLEIIIMTKIIFYYNILDKLKQYNSYLA